MPLKSGSQFASGSAQADPKLVLPLALNIVQILEFFSAQLRAILIILPAHCLRTAIAVSNSVEIDFVGIVVVKDEIAGIHAQAP